MPDPKGILGDEIAEKPKRYLPFFAVPIVRHTAKTCEKTRLNATVQNGRLRGDKCHFSQETASFSARYSVALGAEGREFESPRPDFRLCFLFSTFYSLLSTLYFLLSTLYSLLSTLYSLLSTLYSLLSTLYSLLSTLYSLLSTLYSLLSFPGVVVGFGDGKWMKRE